MQEPTVTMPSDVLANIDAALSRAQSTLFLLGIAGRPSDGFHIPHQIVTQAVDSALQSVSDAITMLNHPAESAGGEDTQADHICG